MGIVAIIDPDSSSIEFIVVHVSNRTESSLWIFKLHKGKPTWLPCFHVGYQADLDDTADFREGLMQLFFRCVEGKVSNKDIVFYLLLLLLRLGWKGREGMM